MAQSMLPVKPGAPARGPPTLSVNTRSRSQYTPAKLQGSEVKSQDEKKLELGMSQRDLRVDWRAKKSTGSRIARTETMQLKNSVALATGLKVARFFAITGGRKIER